ncbi:hypothetical protein L5G28_18090 [Gordonia sp. HY285]|uniref:hypothetical protein n=1 Tax=Gordonia liuliyuniae TaxID=2911517 RepID=UPI001F342528|nr:hypothetical protein [Gordonia liuliyuniae]MCF8612057.1 hypothetical protein [Gordonia liuliyuniae]
MSYDHWVLPAHLADDTRAAIAHVIAQQESGAPGTRDAQAIAFTAGFAVYDPQYELMLDPRNAMPGRFVAWGHSAFPVITPPLVDRFASALHGWLTGDDSSYRMHQWTKLDL